MGKEFELKYAAAHREILKGIELLLGCEAEIIKMSTTYYDTKDAALSKRKWTLRLRQENDDHVVTFKTAGDGRIRGEWEYHADTVEFAAETLVDLGAPEELAELLADGVEPVCGAKFTRRAITAETEGAVLEVALDEGKLFREDREKPFCEVEVELKQGREEAAVAFAKGLAEQFGLVEEKKSKFVRAVNL